jgi:hypothetical protein
MVLSVKPLWVKSTAPMITTLTFTLLQTLIVRQLGQFWLKKLKKASLWAGNGLDFICSALQRNHSRCFSVFV